VHLVDGGEQFVKVNANAAQTAFVDDGTVECSSFVMTDAGRTHVERGVNGCYTGGIDVHAARGWTVRSNCFEGIYCETEGLAEHAIHFWRGCRDTLVENNTIINCARGIGFGMGDGDGDRPASDRSWPDSPYGGADLGHVDGIIRNNVIWADIEFATGYDSGITIEQARQPLVVHNTVVSTTSVPPFFSSIDYRFARTDVIIQNNLTRRITQRNDAAGTVADNLEDTPLGYFVDPGSDFHLTDTASGAIDQGVTVAESGLDLDGEPHDVEAPDLGADEYRP
jgi:hypothetical protein